MKNITNDQLFVMDDKTLRKVQLVQLDILNEFKRVCNLIGIDYFLESGTLLGAVRHKGFIPWDDDLDVAMMRDEYELFLKEAPKILHNDYEIVSWRNAPEYAHPFIKIIKKGTLYKEHKDDSHNPKNGIYIDVFPYDVFPEKKTQQFVQGTILMLFRGIVRAKCNCKTWRTISGVNVGKYIKNIPLRLISFLFSKNTAVSIYEKYCIKYNKTDSDYVYINGAFAYGKEIHSVKSFKSFKDYDFEKGTYKGPSDYDLFLTELYGDYMKLPPENERKNRHMIVELSFGKSCEVKNNA